MNNNTKRSVESDPLRRLSPREHKVFRLVVEGKTSREIALIVGVTSSTIQTYRSRIMRKLETGNIADLVRLAIRRGVIAA
jgi:DNA-binding CsgD family transcriptional regulator